MTKKKSESVSVPFYKPPKLDMLSDTSLKYNYCCSQASVHKCLQCKLCVYGKELVKRALHPSKGKKTDLDNLIDWLHAFSEQYGEKIVGLDGEELFAGRIAETAIMYLENSRKAETGDG